MYDDMTVPVCIVGGSCAGTYSRRPGAPDNAIDSSETMTTTISLRAAASSIRVVFFEQISFETHYPVRVFG